MRRELCELKHLSSMRKIEQMFIPLVVASEKGKAQTLPRLSLLALRGRGVKE